MQVSFSEEFGFDLKSEVEKSARLGLRKAGAICNCCWPAGNLQQATTSSVLHHLSPPLFTEIPGSQPRAYMDHMGLSRRRIFQSLPKLPGRGAHGLCWNVQLAQWDFAQRPRKARNLPYKPQVLGYNLTLGNILGPCWGLGPWSTFHHDANISHSESTQPHVIWQRVGRAKEGLCQLLIGFSSISLVSLSSSSSPLSERITLPCQVRKSIPSPAGQTASQTCVYFLGWHM